MPKLDSSAWSLWPIFSGQHNYPTQFTNITLEISKSLNQIWVPHFRDPFSVGDTITPLKSPILHPKCQHAHTWFWCLICVCLLSSIQDSLLMSNIITHQLEVAVPCGTMNWIKWHKWIVHSKIHWSGRWVRAIWLPWWHHKALSWFSHNLDMGVAWHWDAQIGMFILVVFCPPPRCAVGSALSPLF